MNMYTGMGLAKYSPQSAQWGTVVLRLNVDQQQAIQAVHIFTQQYYSICRCVATGAIKRFLPRTKFLHLTFR